MGKNHASYDIDEGIVGTPIVDEHVMVALYELMEKTGGNKGDLFRLTSGFRKDSEKIASSHTHASAIDIGSGNDSKKLMSFFFKDYTVPGGQSKRSFNAHNHTYELTEEGAAFLKRHNMRILDERGRPGSAHWHFDFYNPGFENVDPNRTYSFHEKGKKSISSTKPGAFNVVVYGNKTKTYQDNGLQETDRYKQIVKILEPDAMDGGKYGTIYNMGLDSNFVKTVLPSLGTEIKNLEKPIVQKFEEKESDGLKLQQLKQKVELFNNIRTANYQFNEEEQKDLKKQIFDHTKKFHKWLEGEIELPELKDNSPSRNDNANRKLYLKYLQENIKIDADGNGTIKTLKELSNSNIGELGRKRGFINYLHVLTDGNEYAKSITDEGPMRLRDSNLLNMMQDSYYTPRKMQEHLSIPVEGELDDINAENFLNDDIFKEFVSKSKDAEGRVRYFPSPRHYESVARQGINDGTEDYFMKYILNQYIRDNDLNDENYSNEKAPDVADNIIKEEVVTEVSPETEIIDEEEEDEEIDEEVIDNETEIKIEDTEDKEEKKEDGTKTFYPPLKSLTDTPTVSKEDASLLNQANTAVTALKAGAGLLQLGRAMQDIPAGEFPEISQAYQGYAAKMKQLSQTGLTASEKTAIRQDLTDAYQAGIKNVLRASGGNRGLFLANAGVLNSNRVEGLLKMGALDAATQRDNLKQYGEVLKIQETFNQKSGILAEQMKYDESKRKSDLYGTLGSTLIGSAISDIAYATEKGRTNKAEDIFTKLLGSSITSAEIARDAQDDAAFSINLKTGNE